MLSNPSEKDGGLKPLPYFLYYWLPVALYCMAIFIQSSFPTSEKIPSWPHFDKFLHFFLYAILGALCLRAFRTLSLKCAPAAIIFFSIMSTSLYGISDELHQYFVPSRTADVWDAMADMLGACGGVLIFHWGATINFFRRRG